MRFGRTLAPLLIAVFALSAASAQPKRGRAQKPDKEQSAKPSGSAQKDAEPSSKAEAGAQEGSTKSETNRPATEVIGEPPPDAASSGNAGDLGEPPPATREAQAGTKLSPLTPNADEFPGAAKAPAPIDFDRLLGDIAALRSRVSALTTTLFKSKVRVVIETRGADARIDALAVTLDDGVVFVAPERFSADDERIVYEHAVAPGQHVIGIDVERYDARKREYRSWQTSKFAVLVPESQLVEARFVLDDDSEMAADFPDDQDGEYDLRVRLRALVTR